jgi:cardiolipin synthase
MIVDGELCTIGSANFDPRSFRINEEISVAMLDSNIAAELRAAFDADVQNSEEWTLARWQARTFGHTLRDRLSAWCKREL